jgi:hypothetical protein
MWHMWLAIAVTVLIAASVVLGWAAKLTVTGGTLQVFTFPVDLGPVVATVDIDPDTLNPGSEGNFVAELSPTEVADHDGDGIPDRMVKFNRAAVLGLIDGESGDVTFVVGGELVDEQTFEGSDTVTLTGGLEPSALAAAGPAPTAPLDRCTEYQVQPGDTLWDIATRFGTTVEVLVRLNRLQNANLILYGSTLDVPYVGEDTGGATADVFP